VQAQISPEVDLLVACAHPSLDSKTTQRIQTLSQGLIDWDNLIQLATVHRTLGLLYRNLNHCCPQSVPIQTRTYLEEQYYYTAGYNSFLANSLVNTLKALAAGGVRALPFKGPTLAVSAFGSLALRHPGDLDILVRPADLDQARQVLLSQGFVSVKQDECENHLISADRRINLDLHWRLRTSTYRSFAPPRRWWQHLQPVSLADTTVLQFGPEETLLILCINATKSIDLIKLTNVCAIAAQLHAFPKLHWASVRKQARILRCQRMLNAGLLLARDMFGGCIPEAGRQAIDRCLRSRAVASLLRHRLFQDQKEIHSLQRLLHSLMLGEDHRELREGLKALLAPNDRDRQFLPLPAVLSHLHFFIRPIRLLVEHGTRTHRGRRENAAGDRQS
jgi:hypothetical protein